MPAAAMSAEPADISEDINELRNRAWEEGFERGREAGLEVGMKEADDLVAQLSKVLQNLARPLEQLDHRVEDEILALVGCIARQLVSREIRLDPTHVIGLIREGLAALPLSAEDVTLCLHPKDEAIVRERLQSDDQERPWRIEADPMMERGGCRILSSSAQVDGQLETRLARVIANMLQDHREDESAE